MGRDRHHRAERGRVTIWATDQPLYALIRHSLVRGTAVIWNAPTTAAEIDGPQSSKLIAVP
jgi:hypothetical protein